MTTPTAISISINGRKQINYRRKERQIYAEIGFADYIARSPEPDRPLFLASGDLTANRDHPVERIADVHSLDGEPFAELLR